MDVQTQIMDQPVISNQLIDEQNKFETFKAALADVRALRISIVQKINGLIVEVKNLVSSRDNAIGMFNSEAGAMYPELQGQDISSTVSSLASTHPLKQLWDVYAERVASINQSLGARIDELKNNEAMEDQTAYQEKNILDLYSSFQINAVSELPTVEQMLQSLQQVEVIPYVDESSTIVSLNQIEKLNPEAAAIVTKEIASSYTDDGTDYNDEDEQTKSMRMSLQPVEGAVSQGAALVPVEPNYKKITLGVGCLFLAWVLFGRKN